MAKVKYFDFEKNLWGEKRPLKESLQAYPPGTRWVLSSTDFKEVEPSDRLYDSFCDFLSSNRPHVALLHSSPAFILRIKSNKNVRKHYAVVETRGGTDDSVALVLAEAPVEVVSDGKDSKSLKFLSVFSIGSPKGASLSVILAAAADSGVVSQRSAENLIPWKATSDSDVTLFACNFIHSNHSVALREMCKNAHFVDVLEKMHERSEMHSSWSLWVRAARYDVELASASGRRGEPRQTLLHLLPRSTQSPQQQSLIDIPMPRSAKATVKTSGGGGAVLTDPAVLSAERSGKSIQELYTMPRRKPSSNRWKIDQCLSVKSQDGKLTSYESAFDLSRFFNSPAEAVESLNHGDEWSLDYCIVNQVVLYSSAVTSPDRPSFRRYAKEHQKLALQCAAMMTKGAGVPGSASAASIAASWQQQAAQQPAQQQQQVQNTLAAQAQAQAQAQVQAQAQRVSPGSEYALFARAARQGQHTVDNPREWSESSSIIIYQTTPREMKFNITHLVPVAKDALRQTILYLNRHPGIPQDQNPLYDYPYDYALLQSVEHQGFWLIAAKNVPCDIVACRMVV